MADIHCALCGEPIQRRPEDREESRTAEHAIAKQFYPESIRLKLRKQLWTVPTHRKCNASYKADEEYFYHRFYPLVGVSNPEMGKIILDDLRRRAQKTQSKVMIRHMLNECRDTSPGGILLPNGMIWVRQDLFRIQRVAVKIVQCLFHKDYGKYLPRANCEHCEICEEPEKMQYLFAELCKTERYAVEKTVFCYWYVEIDGIIYYSMLFWGAFMFCLAFRVPKMRDDCILTVGST